jgi:hypothetical protein
MLSDLNEGGALRAIGGHSLGLGIPRLGKEEKLMAQIIVHPGQPAPVSGFYRSSGGGSEYTAVQGHRMPPTKIPGEYWVLVQAAHHVR